MGYSEEFQVVPQLNLTFNDKFSRALCLAKTVDCNDFIFTAVN